MWGENLAISKACNELVLYFRCYSQMKISAEAGLPVDDQCHVIITAMKKCHQTNKVDIALEIFSKMVSGNYWMTAAAR